jgi:hypothetical protein
MKLHATRPALFTLALTLSVFQSAACSTDPEPSPCLNKSTFVGNGARAIIEVPVPLDPGAVAVRWKENGRAHLSSSGRLFLGDDGVTLYALHSGRVVAIDLATYTPSLVTVVGGDTGRLIGSISGTELLVTQPDLGAVSILDAELPAESVQVPVAAGATAIALAPGNRIAYYGNPTRRTVGLVETGLGRNARLGQTVLVASRTEGLLVELDADAGVIATHDGLPAGIQELALLPDGHTLVGTFSGLATTGYPAVIGDGQVEVREGHFFLDLETGASSVHALAPLPGFSIGGNLARPTGLALLGDRALAIALPGWSAVAIVDLESPSRDVEALHPVPGRPAWVTAASLGDDALYVLDSEAGQVFVLDGAGQVRARIPLR